MISSSFRKQALCVYFTIARYATFFQENKKSGGGEKTIIKGDW
jgi:hypothetical protein